MTVALPPRPSARSRLIAWLAEWWRDPAFRRLVYLTGLAFGGLGLGLAYGSWTRACAGGGCPSIRVLEEYRPQQTAKVYAADGRETGSADLPDELFAQQVNEHLLWLSVKRYLGNQRQGTAKVKARGEVSGGGRKPFKQKGTGRARQGSNTSPLMPGGGRAFGPRPRDHRSEMPRRQRRQALTSALSLRASENAVSVIEALSFAEPKTRQMVEVLEKLGLAEKRTLLVLDQASEAVVKSCRNLPNLKTTLAHQLHPYDLMHCDMVLVTRPGLARMQEVYAS